MLKLQILRRIADLSLFAGTFLTLLGFGTFGWESLCCGYVLLNGFIDITFLEDSIMILGLGLICESLFLMQFGFKTGQRKLPSKNILIGFMFVIGLFLFIAGLSIISSFFAGFFDQLETGYSYSLVGLVLFGASILLWDKERKNRTQTGGRLRWQVVGSFSIAVILFDLFIASNGTLSIPVQMVGFGPFILLVLFAVWLIFAIGRIISLKQAPAIVLAAAPLNNGNLSSYVIIGTVVLLGFLLVPLIPVTAYCNHTIVTGLYFVLNRPVGGSC